MSQREQKIDATHTRSTYRHRKPDWSRYYSGSDEICQYLTDVADEHGLMKYVKMNHEVTKAEWIQSSGKWKFTIKGPGGVFEDHADFYINGGGVLKFVIEASKELCREADQKCLVDGVGPRSKVCMISKASSCTLLVGIDRMT